MRWWRTQPSSGLCGWQTRSRFHRDSAIEIILEFILTAVGEIVLQIGGEFLIELGFHSVDASFRRRTRAHPVLAGAGLIFLGGLGGLVTSLLMPTRLVQAAPVRGASLLLSPLATGIIMDRYGAWLERRDRVRSHAATFWGGALFAFSMALVRFILVGRAPAA